MASMQKKRVLMGDVAKLIFGFLPGQSQGRFVCASVLPPECRALMQEKRYKRWEELGVAPNQPPKKPQNKAGLPKHKVKLPKNKVKLPKNKARRPSTKARR